MGLMDILTHVPVDGSYPPDPEQDEAVSRNGVLMAGTLECAKVDSLLESGITATQIGVTGPVQKYSCIDQFGNPISRSSSGIVSWIAAADSVMNYDTGNRTVLAFKKNV